MKYSIWTTASAAIGKGKRQWSTSNKWGIVPKLRMLPSNMLDVEMPGGWRRNARGWRRNARGRRRNARGRRRNATWFCFLSNHKIFEAFQSWYHQFVFDVQPGCLMPPGSNMKAMHKALQQRCSPKRSKVNWSEITQSFRATRQEKLLKQSSRFF